MKSIQVNLDTKLSIGVDRWSEWIRFCHSGQKIVITSWFTV